MIENKTMESQSITRGSSVPIGFETSLETCVTKIEVASNADELQTYVLTHFLKTFEAFQEKGDYLDSELDWSENPSVASDIYFFNYVFPKDIKELAILHRDVMLQLIRSSSLLKTRLNSEIELKKHFTESKNILKAATKACHLKITSPQDPITLQKYSAKKIIERLSMRSNPWIVYKLQFQSLREQIEQIAKTEEDLKSIEENFIGINKIVSEIEPKNSSFVTEISLALEAISDSLSKTDDAQVQIHGIDKVLLKLPSLGNDQRWFTDELHEQFLNLSDCSIPIAAEEGILQLREISMAKAAQKWFDYQILPDYMELVALEKDVKAKYRITLINLKNGIQLSKTTQLSENKEGTSKIIEKLAENINFHRAQAAKLSEKISTKVREEFTVSRLFEAIPFLAVPMNTTLSSSFNVSKSNFYKEVKTHVNKIYSFFDKRYKRSTYLESFTDIEISTNCIANRMFKDENEHYDILFLTKNFIGDLFLVPRTLQEEKLKEAIDQWNKGFNKAILVHGNHLSGRSTFIDYTATKYFGKLKVTLTPNSLATIDGRKFTTTYDLAEALDYVKHNNSKSTRPVILIDNLELWHDANHSTLDNTRALIEFIENESDNALVVVSTTNIMQNHLDGRIGFSKAFSTNIDVGKTDTSQILKALLLRHGAAHRRLISERGEVISTTKIREYILKISKNYQYNIGEVLQAWTYYTFVKSEEEILFKHEEFEFLDFFTNAELLVLKQTALFNTISEIRLKRLTASGFDSEYRSAIKRLINTKVLLRNSQGYLYINPVIGNDIIQLLNNKVFKTA